MPITINGQAFPDGSPLTVNGTQAQVVTVNGTTVWQNNQVPSAITDFAASDDQEGQITVTFTPATGIPTPTHDLIRVSDGSVIASDISSGYVWTTSDCNVNLRVDAKNSVGTTPSNEDIGISVEPAGSIVFDVVGDHQFTAPCGWNEVSICMVGGGGSGGCSAGYHASGGGYAGQIVEEPSFAVSSGSTIDVTVGGGGSGCSCCDTNSGRAGGQSVFDTLSASGGSGGQSDNSTGYAGNGGSTTNCAGTFYDGTRSGTGDDYDPYHYGGQAAFGNGGNGDAYHDAGGGGVGAGGGASGAGDNSSGAGGRGEVRVSWGSATRRMANLERLRSDPAYYESRRVSQMSQEELDRLGIRLHVNA